MEALINKMLESISDPVLIVVIIGFSITIVMLWRIFEKQHDFFKERVDLLRQENEDLRIQLKEFKEENERLINTSRKMSSILHELQKQPLLSKETTESLSLVAQKADELFIFNQEINATIQKASKELQSNLKSIEHISFDSSSKIQIGIKQIENVINKKERSNEQISIVLNDLVEFIEVTENLKQEQLERIKNNARNLLTQ